MSGKVIPEVRLSGLPVEGVALDLIQAPNRGLESCGMNRLTLNELPSDRSLRTSHVAFPLLTTAAS
jgi:hypothetical protein